MLDLQKRGKHKEAVDNLNLVPFIDLFSTLILFLMATAVFDKLASVPVNMGSNDRSTIKTPDSSATKKVTGTVTVSVSDQEIVMSDEGQYEKIALSDARTDKFLGVAKFMRKARAKHNSLRELVLNSSDKAKYGDLVAVMDEALAEDFDQLVVAGEGQ